jgi:hypothetical protein
MAYNFVSASSQRLTTAAAPTTAAPLTIACWYKHGTAAVQDPLSLSSSTTNYFSISSRGNGAAVDFLVNDGTGNAGARSTSNAILNSWNHACGVAASSTSRTIYLNGGSSATNTTSRTPTVSSVIIGARFSTTAPFNGDIAEVGIWNAALTAAEIASLAKGMTCDKIRPQNLVFYAPLVRDLIDQKGGLAITNNNGATVATHPRVYA